MNCPSGFAVDEVLTHGAGSPAVAAHVASCPRCKQRVAGRRADAEGLAPMAAEVWRAVSARAAKAAPRPWAWRRPPAWAFASLSLAGALAVLAAIAVVRRSPPPAASYVAAKGAFTLTIAARRGAELLTIDAAHPARSGDELRFVPSGGAPGRYVAIASVDGRGDVWLLYPASPNDSSVPMPPAGQPLPGGIVLDDAPGPERLFIVISERPVPGAAVRAAARDDASARRAVDATLAAARARIFRMALEKATSAQGGP
jgi:hypothetical protein